MLRLSGYYLFRNSQEVPRSHTPSVTTAQHALTLFFIYRVTYCSRLWCMFLLDSLLEDCSSKWGMTAQKQFLTLDSVLLPSSFSCTSQCFQLYYNVSIVYEVLTKLVQILPYVRIQRVLVNKLQMEVFFVVI